MVKGWCDVQSKSLDCTIISAGISYKAKGDGFEYCKDQNMIVSIWIGCRAIGHMN